MRIRPDDIGIATFDRLRTHQAQFVFHPQVPPDRVFEARGGDASIANCGQGVIV